MLDPFGGSGTTLAVAKKLGRRFLGFELSAEYAKQIKERLAAHQARRPAGRRGRAADQRPQHGRRPPTEASSGANRRRLGPQLRRIQGTTMKFAICNETFQDWPIDKGVCLCGRVRLHGGRDRPVHDRPLRHARSRRPQRAEVRRAGRGRRPGGHRPALAAGQDRRASTSPAPTPQSRRRTAEYLAELARFCADLGGRVMVFGSPQQRNLLPGVDAEQGMRVRGRGALPVLPVLEEGDVILALEPLGPEETNFLVTTAEAVELAERIGSPASPPAPGLQGDGHRGGSDRRISSASTAGSWPISMPTIPTARGRVSAQLDFRPIFQALGEIDYRGWVSVEVFDYSPASRTWPKEASTTCEIASVS